jgi:predicted enzyme related to lactoylglutathione lyase
VRRGIVLSVTALAAGLSQMSVTAAPVGLSSTLASLAVSGAAPASTSASIFDLASTRKAKVAVALGLVILCLIAVVSWQPRNSNPVNTASNPNTASVPRITLTSVMVADQDKALKFYTNVLGFVVKYDVPTGEPGGARWLTVVSPDEPDGMEILLEPMGFAPAKVYQKALFDSAKPLIGLATTDVQKQFDRLKALGVKFSKEPTALDGTTIAVFEDVCSNHIQLFHAPAANNTPNTASLRIKHNTILVNDQDKALKFYTEKLGLVKKRDLPRGNGRWLTVASPDATNGVELLLESVAFPPARTFQEAVHKMGIPLTQLSVADVQKAYERMTNAGVVFPSPPMKMGPVTLAMFDDTCGNLIQLLEN